MTQTAGLPSRALGRSGVSAPLLGLGCWGIGGPDENLGLPMGWSTALGEGPALEGLRCAYEAGVRLFDTADVYGHGRSERLIGALVTEVDRREVVLVSKVGYFAGTAEHGYGPSHMRHQLETTLENLRTDHLDVYFLHHGEFGPHDRYLPGAIEAMRGFQREGLFKAVGMRGPHRFAPHRLGGGPHEDKTERFLHLFEHVRPQVLAVRDNLLTPPARSQALYDFAQANGLGLLVNKVLGQGLLTGTYRSEEPPVFGPGDHRLRKRWYTAPALKVIEDGLADVADVIGSRDADQLVRLACWSVLERSPDAIALVGFTRPWQVAANVAAVAQGAPSPEALTAAREIMARVQERLDADGEVFVDER